MDKCTSAWLVDTACAKNFAPSSPIALPAMLSRVNTLCLPRTAAMVRTPRRPRALLEMSRSVMVTLVAISCATAAEPGPRNPLFDTSRLTRDLSGIDKP